MEHHHLQESQWDKVLAVLNGTLPEATALTAEEGLLLEELKEIRAASTMYQDAIFDSHAKIEVLKQKLDFSEPAQHKTSRLWPRIVAVAAAVTVVVFTVFLFNYYSNKTDRAQKSVYLNDIAPGKVGATLTLANGKKIRLTDVHNGQLAEETGISISKTDDGQLVYEVKGNVGGAAKINTLTTAKGETYILTLPDKSKVWLNAASSLTYFTSLNEHGLRKVKLEGEAYFEIFKDKAHPFVVEADKQLVKVMGTHFNVNSYATEPYTKTTLLEGSVLVTGKDDKKREVTLKPGEEATLTSTDFVVGKTDIEMAVAWKDGEFVFKDESLYSIMRKVERWYDVQVVYKGNFEGRNFEGSISRFKKVSEILSKFELTGNIHFKVEGRRITVMP